jgi:uncharacterized membrane protein
MFIDYLTLMLINLVAGLVLVAAYVYFGLVVQIKDAGFQALVLSVRAAPQIPRGSR